MSDEPAAKLIAFDEEYSDRVVVELHTDELTALCPFDFGGPDFYEVKVRYSTSGPTIEAKSWKQYVESWRDEEITGERLADQIRQDIAKTLIDHDGSVYVRTEQARRGGSEITTEAGDVDLRE